MLDFGEEHARRQEVKEEKDDVMTTLTRRPEVKEEKDDMMTTTTRMKGRER